MSTNLFALYCVCFVGQAVADEETKSDLCDRIGKVAAKFAPTRRWHIDTLTKVLTMRCTRWELCCGWYWQVSSIPLWCTPSLPSHAVQVLALAGSSDESGIDASLLILISQVSVGWLCYAVLLPVGL